MKVNWATSPGHQQKVDTSSELRPKSCRHRGELMLIVEHFHIFVGDLSPEIDNKTLRDAFAPFGEISWVHFFHNEFNIECHLSPWSDAKVIRDLQTLKSKGFGFVSFVNREVSHHRWIAGLLMFLTWSVLFWNRRCIGSLICRKLRRQLNKWTDSGLDAELFEPIGPLVSLPLPYQVKWKCREQLVCSPA